MKGLNSSLDEVGKAGPSSGGGKLWWNKIAWNKAQTQTIILKIICRWVDFGCEESNQHVQIVNAQCIGDYVPSLQKEDASHEQNEHNRSEDPPICQMRSGHIQ